MTKIFSVSALSLQYDVVVCGGGLAGVSAALNAARNGAKTLLVESGGSLGGDITKGIVPNLIDPPGKGGFVRELMDNLRDTLHCAPRRGPHYDAQGNRLPGALIDNEYTMYFLDKALREAGADVFYYSMASALEMDGEKITALLITTEAGNYAVEAPVYIDATGNGLIAGYAGCTYEFGHPQNGFPQPTTMGLMVTGVPDDFVQTDNGEQKKEFHKKLEALGFHLSGTDGTMCIRSATPNCWILSFNFQYNVPHDDILKISQATQEGRRECIEVVEKMRKLPGWEKLSVVAVSPHLGIREGKRILGEYQLTFEDLVNGAHFDDAICLVHFGVDVHAIEYGDSRDHKQGKEIKPYHIPYRSLLPRKCSNLLLAGRCISGDFYAHASYRVACNVIPTGEAAGYAAALCVKEQILPHAVDGKRIKQYMESLGYEM